MVCVLRFDVAAYHMYGDCIVWLCEILLEVFFLQ